MCVKLLFQEPSGHAFVIYGLAVVPWHWCVMTLKCKIVQINKELFQEIYTGSFGCLDYLKKKKIWRRITSLTNIRGFYLYPCERIFQKPPEVHARFSSPPTPQYQLLFYATFAGFNISVYVSVLSINLKEKNKENKKLYPILVKLVVTLRAK